MDGIIVFACTNFFVIDGMLYLSLHNFEDFTNHKIDEQKMK